jgi:hypothetical protein
MQMPDTEISTTLNASIGFTAKNSFFHDPQFVFSPLPVFGEVWGICMASVAQRSRILKKTVLI